MGWLSDLLSPGKDNIIRGATRARNELAQGYETARPVLEQGYDDAIGAMSPYAEGGQAGFSAYLDALGLNGADARAEFQNMLMSDPAFTGALAQDQNAVARAMNARGQGGSGAAALAAERVFQQNYGNTLNRYAGLGDRGMQAAGAQSNLLARQGENLANLDYGYRQQTGNAWQGMHNAVAGSKQAGMNNLIGIAGTATKAMGPGGLFGSKGLFG